MEFSYLDEFLATRGTTSSCFLLAALSELCGCCIRTAPSLSLHSVPYTRNILGDVVVCKSMTDLCATCQKNSAAIVRSFNLSEEEKSEVCIDTFTYTYKGGYTLVACHVCTCVICVIHKPFTRHSKKQRNTYSELLVRDRITAVLWRSVVMPSRHTSVEMESSHFLLLTRALPSGSGPERAHYSFDFAQQVHYPHNPLQPGPMYFKMARKCAVFGVCSEGCPCQINYLIDEASDVGKGANTVISLLHHFFHNHGMGEVTVGPKCCFAGNNTYTL